MIEPAAPPPMSSPDKSTLRRVARDRRREFVARLAPGERDRLERELGRILAPLLANSSIIGSYAPLPAEISPAPALQAAAASGAIIAYPAFDQGQPDFRFLAGNPTETGPWPCLQPALDCPEVLPDLVLVPLVAIDAHGTRLGQGKGHYDRVLGKLREHGATLIGLGWAVQKIDARIPADPWDVRLDGFASPDGLELFR